MPHPCGAAAWKWPNSNRPPGLLEWAFFPRNPMKNRCLRWGMLQLASRPEGRPCRWFFDSVGMGVPPAKLHEKPSAARFGGADQGVPYQAGFSPLSSLHLPLKHLYARRATINSSLVLSASTVTFPPAADTTRSPLPAFFSASSSIPRNSSPAQHLSRSRAEFSPIPPVNATASIPPIAAAYAPIVFFTWYTNTSSARSACGRHAASRSRTSPPATPDSPPRPPPPASCRRTSSALHPWRSIM